MPTVPFNRKIVLYHQILGFHVHELKGCVIEVVQGHPTVNAICEIILFELQPWAEIHSSNQVLRGLQGVAKCHP